jgi:hypothetical protein
MARHCSDRQHRWLLLILAISAQHLLKVCLRRQVSQSLTVERRNVLPAVTPALQSSRLSAAHSVSNHMMLTHQLSIRACADKTVPSRVNETSGDRAPRLRKSDKVFLTARSLKHTFTGQRSDRIIAILIAPSAIIAMHRYRINCPDKSFAY